MSIFPLPVFEADADPRHRTAMSDEEVYARLEPPKTIVVKFGSMKLVGEFPYDGPAKPGCGSKLVARTHRGTELVEMLTTTCSNSGCGKSISRQEMLDYIENSGGREYPFHQNGRILRVATIEDLNRQSALDSPRKEHVRYARAQAAELGLAMKIVEAEPILGGELVTFYYMCEERVDFRELVQRLAGHMKTRIEMRQVGARDEARLVADYERCGQHCCCKNFLKVLKPISMRSAKVQKATLDPLKISGRCGRLMCCLRYEDQTYTELKKNLPPRNKRVGTSEGPGVVVDSKILVQLVLVRLEHDGKEIAVPVEELMHPDQCPKPGEAKAQRDAEAEAADPFRGMSAEEVERRVDGSGPKQRGEARPTRRGPARNGAGQRRTDPQRTGQQPSDQQRTGQQRTGQQRQEHFRKRSQTQDRIDPIDPVDHGGQAGHAGPEGAAPPPPGPAGSQPPTDATPPVGPQGAADRGKRPRKRRRRRGKGPPENHGPENRGLGPQG